MAAIRQNAGMPQRPGPRQAVRLQPGCGADLAKFGLAHAGLLLWRVAKPRVPHHAPHQAQETEHEEGRAPAIAHLNRHDENGRQAAPIWAVIHTKPQARVRLAAGIQRAMTADAFG